MTDWEYTFIAEHRVARLGTVDAHGQPAVVPIVYAFDGIALFTPLDAKPKRVATPSSSASATFAPIRVLPSSLTPTARTGSSSRGFTCTDRRGSPPPATPTPRE